jgi:thioester reductase-like protein
MTQGSTLLTGATGGVGPHLLAALLEGGARNVTCIVRAEDDGRAAGRVEKALTDAGYDAAASAKRLRAIAGDLALPRFGLSSADFAELAESTAHVVHNAAWLGQHELYHPDACTNVASATTIAEMCMRRGIRLDHVSTIGVLRWTEPDEDGCYFEEAFSEHPEPPLRGGPYAYYFSKWMAEQLAIYASARAPVTVHRLGDIFQRDGDAPMAALAGAVAQLRALPDDDSMCWAAHSISDAMAGRAIAAIANLEAEELRVVHGVAFVDGVTVADVRHAFAHHGVALERIAKDAWVRRARAEVPWIGMLAEWQIEYLVEPKSPKPRYDNERFRQCVAAAGLALPTVADRLSPAVASVLS